MLSRAIVASAIMLVERWSAIKWTQCVNVSERPAGDSPTVEFAPTKYVLGSVQDDKALSKCNDILADVKERAVDHLLKAGVPADGPGSTRVKVVKFLEMKKHLLA
jgi:hypothetical protein